MANSFQTRKPDKLFITKNKGTCQQVDFVVLDNWKSETKQLQKQSIAKISLVWFGFFV